jgi:hypothetical protein
MNMFRFRDRAEVLDERSRSFLTTVAWLGGYVTPEQAQLLGIRNSVPRVHVQLKDLEDWGFIKRVGAYPAIYQVTKSVTRLMGADLAARREHANDTIRTRLLTVNFYLEAIRWPVEFVFDHKQKISRLWKLGCEPALLPERRARPYLWQDILLQRPSGELVLPPAAGVSPLQADSWKRFPKTGKRDTIRGNQRGRYALEIREARADLAS